MSDNGKCKKCGGTKISGPRHHATRDVLVYQCWRCGYSWSDVPNDRSSSDMRDFFR